MKLETEFYSSFTEFSIFGKKDFLVRQEKL